MKIAMVASEINPLAKSGGLADVIFALSKEYVRQGDEVCCIMPYYKLVEKNLKTPIERVGGYPVYLSWRRGFAEIFKTEIEGITYYLIANNDYFGRPALYGYDDDGERFAFFTSAARGLFEFVKFKPDIIHLHDWQVGMLPCLIKIQNKNTPLFKEVRYVFTIHNPAFKGYLQPDALGNLYNLPMSVYEDGSTRLDGMVSTFKTAIVYSDKVTTVSPTHRDELLAPATSFGLSEVMKTRELDFCGFVNGVDTDEFDPANDSYLLPNKISLETLAKDKKAIRDAYFKECGMIDHGGPTFGLVSRLTSQKGIDLIYQALPKYLDKGAHFLVCGSGDFELERKMEDLKQKYPTQVGVYIGYSNEKAHKIYAASEFFLMPSSFEPCGIGQLIAQRYGTLPIVRKTGGLADTVAGYKDVENSLCTGVSFNDYDIGGMEYGLATAAELYKKPKIFAQVQKNCFLKDNSWAQSAKLYRGLYKSLC